MQQAMQQSQQMASTGKMMLEMIRYRLAMMTRSGPKTRNATASACRVSPELFSRRQVAFSSWSEASPSNLRARWSFIDYQSDQAKSRASLSPFCCSVYAGHFNKDFPPIKSLDFNCFSVTRGCFIELIHGLILGTEPCNPLICLRW